MPTSSWRACGDDPAEQHRTARPHAGDGTPARRDGRRRSDVRALARPALLLALAAGAACAGRPPAGPPPGGDEPAGGAPRGAPPRRGASPFGDMSGVYQQLGLLVGRGDVPFVASVAFFAGRSSDSTIALVTLSMVNRALTFVREGDRYRAPYEVRLDVRRGTTSVRQVASEELVRVATFRETARTDESVVFFQLLTLAPGAYDASLAVRDVEGGRTGTADAPLTVPRLGPGTLSSAVPVHEATLRPRLDTLPHLVASARAGAAFGQDSVVQIYLEAYGRAATPQVPIAVRVLGEQNAQVWSDTARLARSPGADSGAATQLYAGLVSIPVSRLGIGIATVALRRTDTGDSTRARLFVSLGEDLPITSFDEMLNYLRYYASPDRLRALQERSGAARAEAWSAFLKQSDPDPATTQHEGLRAYFGRIRQANVRFNEEGTPGWLTDRGMALVGMGEPDNIVDQGVGDVGVRGRTMVWEYRDQRIQLVFVDQTGYGRWRLNPSSAAEVQGAIRRRQIR